MNTKKSTTDTISRKNESEDDFKKNLKETMKRFDKIMEILRDIREDNAKRRLTLEKKHIN